MAELVYATAISCWGRAALIRGRSGAGKSDLALRCLALGPSPMISESTLLISDDQVLVEERQDGCLWASAPEAIRGKLEVRGLGIVELVPGVSAPITLIVDLVPSGEVERLPEENAHASLLGRALPLLKLSPFEASAPAKLLLALERARQWARP